MSFWASITQLRTILASETDYDSPVSEELMEQMRENIEALFMLLLDTYSSGTATSNPPNDTTGVLTDSAGGYSVDEHNARTLLITSGDAMGNMYTIDDTTATTLVCTGDNLYSGGVRSGDSYKVLYNVKTNQDGHDHDGINSKSVVLADLAVTTAKINDLAVTTGKIANGEVTGDKMTNDAGGTRRTGGGTANCYYEVMDVDGTWNQCSETIDDSP